MAYIIDRETKQFWKYVGQEMTSDIAEAYVYPESIAQAICRIMDGDCYYIEPKADENSPDKQIWYEHDWQPQSKNSPHRTAKMIEKRLVWVAFQGMWTATDRQALLLGTLSAFNMPSPIPNLKIKDTPLPMYGDDDDNGPRIA
jgi:hypothetical protein